MTVLTRLSAAVAVVAFACGVSHAATIVSTATGNGADTFLENDNQGFDGSDPIGSAAFMNGGATNLQFRRFDGVRQKLVMLRFDISSLDPSTYADARLQFEFTSNRGRDMRVYGILDGNDNWDEATINYLTAPGILSQNDVPAGPDAVAAEIGLDPTQLFFGTGGPNPFQLGTIPIFDSEVPPGGGADIPGRRDITFSNPADLPLGDFLNADTDGLVTFLMFLEQNNASPLGQITSKEGSLLLAPRLGLVPEPTSACLMVIGAAAFGLRRRS